MRNAQDGISMLQTAEGALEEVHSMMQRMRELAVQSANDTYSADDRKAINNELKALQTEINAISDRTKFNGKGLLSGALATKLDATSEIKGGVSAQAGLVAATASLVSFANVDTSKAVAGTTFTLSENAGNLRMTATIGGASVTQDIAIGAALTAPGAVGATGTQTFDFTQFGIKLDLAVTRNGATGAATSAEIGAALTAGPNTVITATGSSAANFQIGAGSGGVAGGDAISVSFSQIKLKAASTGAATQSTDVDLRNLADKLETFDAQVTGGTFATAHAEQLISALDSAITVVNDKRGSLGAVQNRLEHSIKALAVNLENLASSESRIRDTDVAEETSNMVRAQILSQAGTSVLAQANQVPQGALSLLKG
jgi:flagellin